MPGWPIPSLTCSSNGSGGCDCTGYQYPHPINPIAVGTYTTSESTLTLTPPGGTPVGPLGYCVDGYTVWLQASLGAPGVTALGFILQ